MPFHEVASVNDLQPGEGKVLNVNGTAIALFNLNGNFYATQNTCPHRGGPLGEGKLDEDGVVTCPWHGYAFYVTTGEPFNFPTPIKTYPVKVENGRVFVDVE